MVRRYDNEDWTMQWTCFEPDRAFSVVKDDHKAGYFSYRLLLKSFKSKKLADEDWHLKIP